MEKNKVGMIAIIVILIVMFSAITGAFVYTINLLNKTKAAVETTATIDGKQMQDKEDVVEYTLTDVEYYSLPDSITANLLSDKADSKLHMAIVSVSIGLNQKDKDYKKMKLLEMITAKKVVINDTVIKILQKKTYEELKKPDSAVALGEEILGTLQELFGTNAIVEVRFDKFTYQ